MAKFIFRLQSFLSLKEKIEDQKKQIYALALSQLEKEKQVKVVLLKEKNNNINAFREKAAKKINPREFVIYNNYIDLLKKKIIHQEKVIALAEQNAEDKRLELVQSVKERKMLETLKEKEHTEFLKEQQIVEQKIVDEIVSYRFNNREA